MRRRSRVLDYRIYVRAFEISGNGEREWLLCEAHWFLQEALDRVRLFLGERGIQQVLLSLPSHQPNTKPEFRVFTRDHFADLKEKEVTSASAVGT